MLSWTITLTLILSYIVYKILYGLFFNKLNQLPGPWYTLITNLVETYYRILGKQFYYYQYLHDKYGPVVRVAPNRVLFNDITSVKQIYQSYSFAKGPIYQIFTPFGDNLFSTNDKYLHQSRKRQLLPTFSSGSILSMEPLVYDKVSKLINKMNTLNKCNLYNEIHLLTFDIIAQLVFDKPFNTLNTLSHPIIHWLKKITIFAVVDGIFKISKIYEPECKKQLRNFINEAIQEAKSKQGIIKPNNILAHFIEAKDPETKLKLNDQQLLAECLTQLIAGSDTTCNSIIWCLYLTLKHDKVYRKVQQEIDAHFQLLNQIGYLECKKKLIYLEATIQEAMRLFPVSSGLLARMVPEGGKTLNGYYIPEKTEVGTSFYCFHRSIDLFDNANEFIPERWLGQESQSSRNKSMPFLMGPRACLGRELGWMEMYLILTSLYLNYEMSLDDAYDINNLMLPEYFLVLRPSGSNLPILFKKRKNNIMRAKSI